MATAHLDAAASTPDTSSPCCAGQAAADDLWRLPWWLDRLTAIGYALVGHMSGLAAERRTNERPVADLILGWALVLRATRWILALQARLATRPVLRRQVAKTASMDGADGRPGHGGLRESPSGRPVASPALHVRISGLPTAQVVRQICADLNAAAALLGADEAGRQITEIVAEARALLDDEAEPATRLLGPPVARRHGAAEAAETEAAETEAAETEAAETEPVDAAPLPPERESGPAPDSG